MLVRVQHSVYAGFGRHIDRSGRQSSVFIGIIRRVHFQMLLENPVQCISVAESYGRIGLKPDAFAQTVELHSGYLGIFESLEGLPAHYRSQYRHFIRRKSLCGSR